MQIVDRDDSEHNSITSEMSLTLLEDMARSEIGEKG